MCLGIHGCALCAGVYMCVCVVVHRLHVLTIHVHSVCM